MRLTDLEKRTLIQVIEVYLSFDFNNKLSKRSLRVENIKRKLSAELSKSLDNKTMKNTLSFGSFPQGGKERLPHVKSKNV